MAAPAAQQLPQTIRARDLAAVALKAATELDSLIRNEHSSLDGIRELAEQLSAKVVRDPGSGPASLMDPTTTIVLGRAVGDAGGGSPQQVADVTAATQRWIAQMAELLTAANQSEDWLTSLINLRSFCLAVSRHATAMTPSPLDRPDHSFRRLRA